MRIGYLMCPFVVGAGLDLGGNCDSAVQRPLRLSVTGRYVAWASSIVHFLTIVHGPCQNGMLQAGLLLIQRLVYAH